MGSEKLSTKAAVMPHNALGKPKRAFADTFSAMTAIRQQFQPAASHSNPEPSNDP